MVYTGGDMKHIADTYLQPDNVKQLMATDEKAKAEKNPQKPKPQRIDLTPEEPITIGYVGGVHVPKMSA